MARGALWSSCSACRSRLAMGAVAMVLRGMTRKPRARAPLRSSPPTCGPLGRSSGRPASATDGWPPGEDLLVLQPEFLGYRAHGGDLAAGNRVGDALERGTAARPANRDRHRRSPGSPRRRRRACTAPRPTPSTGPRLPASARPGTLRTSSAPGRGRCPASPSRHPRCASAPAGPGCSGPGTGR